MYEKIIGSMKTLQEEIGLLPTKFSNHKLQKQNIRLKVFLGGTCNGRDYRQDLIPMIKIPYFNPVVDNWTPQDQENERIEKEEKCGIHLYVITPEIKGVFSIAEAVQSTYTQNVVTVFCILNKEMFEPQMLKSLEATEGLLKDNGALVTNSLGHLSEVLNSYQNSLPEDFAGTVQALAPTPIPTVSPGIVKIPTKMKPKKEENQNERVLKV